MVQGTSQERMWFYEEHAGKSLAGPNMMPGNLNSSQNAVFRLANLPMVSSACALVSVLYCDTKHNHPYIRSLCEVVEISVTTLSSVACNSATPIIIKLEPQISVVNDLACKGLDKLESTLPVLQQPSQQIVSDVKNIMMEAKDAVVIAVYGAKNCMHYTLTGMVAMTKGASGGRANIVSLEPAVQLVSMGLKNALSLSETLVDQALPPTDEEMEDEVKTVTGFDVAAARPSSPVRLVSLTVKLCRRAYHQAEEKMRFVKVCCQKSLNLLQHTMHLDNLGALVEWTSNVQEKEDKETEGVVIHCLNVSPSVSHQLQRNCLTLACSLQNLPRHLQQQAVCVLLSASQILNNFSSTDPHLGIRPQGKVSGSLDAILDYLVHNMSLNCLVGPWCHQMPPITPRGQTNGQRKRPAKKTGVFDLGCTVTPYEQY
ncbi:perilipin-2-like isoform X1 [Oncorhynchus keta]|uniref:perilipin-2-like isoform X1 n=1 Tax=Oncorhynchus keta TaxID=8018 RepID=UPI0015F83C00|nr:perilipin-2-like isoform X1 [Oncorhynchus keta]